MQYGSGQSAAPRGRAWLIVLALGALLLLWMQLRARPVVVRSWGGAPPGIQAEARPITGHAAVQATTIRLVVGVDVPTGDPLRSPHVVMTQGYGVGSHAPANVWGAVDLAIDGDGDGVADPGASLGAPIYATHRGTVKLAPNSVPAGNHVWVLGEQFKTGYSHLQDFAPGLQDGQVVEAGTLIGSVGSTGQSSGPHLDYHVWKDGVNVNPAGVISMLVTLRDYHVWKDGVNVNPLDYGALLQP